MVDISIRWRPNVVAPANTSGQDAEEPVTSGQGEPQQVESASPPQDQERRDNSEAADTQRGATLEATLSENALMANTELVARDVSIDKKKDTSPLLDESDSCFECNICLEPAHEPVVTLCGHLHCWPCLYKWLSIHADMKQCPVCKAPVDEEKVVPLYGRGSSQKDPRSKIVAKAEIPDRPQGQRPAAGATDLSGNLNFSTGVGFLPSVFGLQLNSNSMGAQQGTGLYSDLMSVEQQQQAFLSRLLLMLGSFVIMCLLLF